MRAIGSFIWGKIFVLFFRPLYWLEHTKPVWRFSNRNAIRHFKKHGRSPSIVENRIIGDLQRDGISVTHLTELFPDGEKILKELISYTDFTKGETHPQKPFITNFFELAPLVSLDNPFARIALHESVLTIAGRYLGMTPKLQEFALAEIKAVPEGTEKTGSMRWHRDPNDRRLMKMFIYLSDVGPEQGPFTYIKKSNAENAYGRVCPQVPPAGIYPAAEEVEKKVDRKDIFPAMGKAGSVVFADTAGLHGGGYVLTGSRRMSTFGYIPPKSFLVRILKYAPKPGDTLSSLQEYALTGSEALFSRELYKWLRTVLIGKESLGPHIMGRM